MLIVSSLSTVNENRLEADDAGLYLGPLGLSAVYSTTSKRSYQLNTDSSRALLRPRLTVCISRTADNSQKKTLSSRSSSVVGDLWERDRHEPASVCAYVQWETTSKNNCFSNIIQTFTLQIIFFA